jgi:hypothetical protein
MTVTIATRPAVDAPARAAAPAAPWNQEGDAVSAPDIVDVWGRDSFPASDPPANW